MNQAPSGSGHQRKAVRPGPLPSLAALGHTYRGGEGTQQAALPSVPPPRAASFPQPQRLCRVWAAPGRAGPSPGCLSSCVSAGRRASESHQHLPLGRGGSAGPCWSWPAPLTPTPPLWPQHPQCPPDTAARRQELADRPRGGPGWRGLRCTALPPLGSGAAPLGPSRAGHRGLGGHGPRLPGGVKNGPFSRPKRRQQALAAESSTRGREGGGDLRGPGVDSLPVARLCRLQPGRHGRWALLSLHRGLAGKLLRRRRREPLRPQAGPHPPPQLRPWDRAHSPLPQVGWQ